MSPRGIPGSKMSPEERRDRQRRHYTNTPVVKDKQKHGKYVGGMNMYPHKSKCTCGAVLSYVDPEGDEICGQCGLNKE